jgi:transketolase
MIKKQKNTRHIFFEVLEKIMEKDKKVVFITGDLGYSYMERIQKRFPKQFINAGCMEQSATGIAVGLSMAGFKPYLYSTLNFILFRNLEQIRNDVVVANNNVKIIGVSMSGFIGFTHNRLHTKEDTNLCENIGLKAYTPTLKGLDKLLIKTSKNTKPCYIRL